MRTGAAHWTAERVEPVVNDLVRSELARLRPGAAGRHSGGGRGDGAGDGPGGGTGDGAPSTPADSLELLALATAVSRQFHIHETGLDDLLLARRSSAAWAEMVVRSRAMWDEAVTFSTSGSTGAPTHCTHRMPDLEAETRFLTALLAGRRRVLRVQPAHHIYGFIFTFLLPAALGLPVVDVRAHGPASLLRLTRPGDLVVAHPHYLDLATGLPGRAADDVTVVTSTAPCDPAIWGRLGEAGVARMVEVYGSSETAGIGWRQHPEQPFALMPSWRRAGAAGIRPPTGDGGVRTVPDHLEWIGDGAFHVRSRRDGAVQIGGVNVFPGRVRELLLGHPAVLDAAVRPMRPDEGRRLKAYVVPSHPAAAGAALADELMRWVEDRASAPEVPRSVRFGPALPLTDAGKPADWSVRLPEASC